MVLRQRLMEQMESRMQVEDEELRDLIDMAILEAAEGAYLPLKERLCLRKELFDSFRRLDILQELVDDPTITEIMVNGTEHVFVERQGRVEELEKHFDSVGQLEDLIQQIVSRVNRTVNLASPIADARLEDGSRVHVVLAPVALNGPILTIRKFPEPITMERLIELKSISREAAAFLQKAVERGLNIFISGGTGSGKTTILNAMSGYIPQEDRVITIEDSAELQIRHVTNLVSLETRVENRDGSQEISMRDLIRASLRMRPDRIIVGEVRGGEALEMLQAMNTGHDGSLSTGHANSAKDMLSRLETMVLMAAELPLAAVRSQIGSALDLMVHVGRMRDRSRKVLEITEVIGYENGEIRLSPIRKAGRLLPDRWKEHLSRLADLKGGADSREEVLSDYRVYHLTGQEWIRYLLEGTAVCAVTAYVFYRSFLAFVLMLPAGMLRPFFKRRELCRRRKEELRLQFKEAIQIVASALAAGYSVENAFIASVRDLEEQYGKEGMITREFSYLASQLKMNRTVEALLSSFAKRSGLDEVENFSVIFTVSKRSRGELASVVHHVVHVISDRIQVREEILTMTAEKQFEQRIMNLMPYLIVLYVDLSSPGFFSQMYETAVGRVVMTGCLVVYLLAWRVSGKILQIEV